MKDRTSFFVNGALLTATAVCARSVGLVFSAFVTRTVGAQGIGLYTLLMTVYGFALTFATAGISLTVTRLVASAVGEGKEGQVGRILRASAVYAVLFGSVATVALWALSPTLAVRVLADAHMTRPLRVLSLALLPEALSAVLVGYFVGVRRVVGNAATQILTQAFKIAVTCLLIVRVSSHGLYAACLFLSVVSTLTDTVGFAVQGVRFLIVRRRDGASLGGERERAIGSVCAMALPLGLSAYIRSALVTVEHALIPACLRMRGESPSEALASYGLLHAMTLPMLLFPMTLLSSFASLLVPEFAEAHAARDTGRMSRIASRALQTTMTYAVCASVLIAVFSEEIGYCFYDSYEVGFFLLGMAPVVPIMYLDHVTDAMLKGVGEQVYAMWVNITDALLSVVLVRLLIPVMGIGGYALVIVLMEGYNFLLSFVRLRRRIRFSMRPLSSMLLPLAASLLAALASRSLFSMNGAATTPVWLFLKLLFSVCVLVFILTLENVALRSYLQRRGRLEER